MDKLRDGINRILFHILSNEERADRIMELIAPELEKAEKYDALCLIKDPIQVERELFLEVTEKAEKWDKVEEIATMYSKVGCDGCPIGVCYEVLCSYALTIVDALNQPKEVKG